MKTKTQKSDVAAWRKDVRFAGAPGACHCSSIERTYDPLSVLARRLYPQLLRFADRELPPRWITQAGHVFSDWGKEDVRELHLFFPWAFFHSEQGDGPIAAVYERKRGWAHSPRERAWLRAQLETCTSVWRIERIDPASAIVHDILRLETRRLNPGVLPPGLAVGNHFLGRIVDFEGGCFLDGMHPTVFSATEAHHVREELRSFLDDEGPRIDPFYLRDEGGTVTLLKFWRETEEDRGLAGWPAASAA